MFESLVMLQRARLMHRYLQRLDEEKIAHDRKKATAAEFDRNERHIGRPGETPYAGET
jgi:hypothetical protein